MAKGTEQSFKIYQEQFFGGVVEALEQNSNAFNAASNNAIRLLPRILRGYYEQESFIKEITTLISRRNTTSVSAVSDQPMAQGEFVSVKLNRRIGPVANTLDSFRKIAVDPAEMSFLLGQQTGQAIALDYLNSALISLTAALAGQTSLKYNAITSSASGERKTLDHTNLVRGMAKMGDASNRIVAWVMHSKPFFDLMEASIADKIFNVANVTIYEGSVASFNRPVIVTDSPALLTATSSDTDYHVLGLVDEAVLVEESEEREIVSDIITGLENLVMRIQGEYAFNIRVKGFAWDIMNGGANPTDGSLGTSSNWDKISTDNRSLAGVYITVD